MPSSPIRLSAGHLEVLDEQLGGVVIEHRLDRPDLDLAALDGLRCRSTRNTLRPRVLSVSSSYGVVRASSSSRSECSAREVHTFWPLTT